MKILFLLPTICNGGAERVATILANQFVKKHRVSILCIENTEFNDCKLGEDIELISPAYHPIRGNKTGAVFSFISNLFNTYRFSMNYVEKFLPDVIISFLPKADFIAFLICRKKKIIWVASERNDPWHRSKIEKSILNYIYKFTNCLVCQTQTVKRYYENIGIKKTFTIPNPVPELKVKGHGHIKMQYRRYAVAVGRLDWQKNYDLMLDAFAKAREKVSYNYNLLIIGDGPLRSRLMEKISKMKFNDSIVLIGRKSDVYEYLTDAEFFVMSSDYEGMPNALLEAMSSGIPVICTNVRTGAASELIDGKNGMIVPVGSKEDLSNAMVNMMEMKNSEREQMGTLAQRRIKDMSIDTVANTWIKFLEWLVEA